MATNLKIDDKKLAEAVKLGKHKSKREAVDAALDLYIERQKVEGLIDMFGTVEMHPNWDHKAVRRSGNKRIPTDR